MAKVLAKFDIYPSEDIISPKVRLEGKGIFDWVEFMHPKTLLKNTWYEVSITIKESKNVGTDK